MAKPIEPTPILEGQDAKTFLKEIENVSYSEKKARFLDECKNIYKKIKIKD
jgi:hypothetical protein